MTDAADFVPLREVEVSVLLSVVDRPRHGYAILQEADERTGGRPGFEIPTLYRALRRMAKDGLIHKAEPPADEAHDDARREYWRATALGGRVLQAELRRMEVLLAAGRHRTAAERA